MIWAFEESVGNVDSSGWSPADGPILKVGILVGTSGSAKAIEPPFAMMTRASRQQRNKQGMGRM